MGGDDTGHRETPKGGRPGPTDQGHEGGMATRENAPELTGTDDPAPRDTHGDDG
jgi:hypothetical protein